MWGSNRQDFVFIRPPGIAHGVELIMDNMWYCKLLLLFEIESRTDDGMKLHKCALVSVSSLEEFTEDKKPGTIFIKIYIHDIFYIHFINFVINSR